jgi:hypothetical protein
MKIEITNIEFLVDYHFYLTMMELETDNKHKLEYQKNLNRVLLSHTDFYYNNNHLDDFKIKTRVTFTDHARTRGLKRAEEILRYTEQLKHIIRKRACSSYIDIHKKFFLEIYLNNKMFVLLCRIDTDYTNYFDIVIVTVLGYKKSYFNKDKLPAIIIRVVYK